VPPALADAAHGVGEVERTRGDESGPLAEAVPRDDTGDEPRRLAWREGATLVARMAGCACSVRASTSAGPSKQIRERPVPRLSSASS
jgi:hypothetical protein